MNTLSQSEKAYIHDYKVKGDQRVHAHFNTAGVVIRQEVLVFIRV